MVIDDSHVLFNESDFTPDEIERRNVVAVAIIEKQRKVCKFCGREGQELAEPCGASRVPGARTGATADEFKRAALAASGLRCCYECDKPATWLAPDGRCGGCTGYTPEEVRGE